jgi:peptide alpha-N-acetyltransferase
MNLLKVTNTLTFHFMQSKMYKKGIKTADSVLRKFPDNGETLAMKGLLLNCLERKEEAYDYVKRGVRSNIKSHVCWHVYGLLYRSDRDYDEAIKCYKNALRMEKDNLTVLRDLTQLQVQMRDLSGFLDSRQKLLELKPNNRQSWVGLALAHHLQGNHQVAATVIEQYEATVDDVSTPTEAYEHSEILLYKAKILEEGENYGEALKAVELAEKRGLLKDKLSALESRGRLLLKLNRSEEAEGVYRRLLNTNTEQHEYHDGLLSALRLQGAAGDADAVATVYAALQEQYPHSTVARRRPLDFMSGESSAFEAAADLFVRKYIAKGIPSLFAELKPLYVDAAKTETLGRVMLRFEEALTTSGQFPEPVAPPAPHHVLSKPAPGSKGAAEALLWTRLYLSLHYDTLGDVEQALNIIDGCIEKTPSLVELHSARARILKHAGDFAGAAAAAQHARTLDPSDRYLNCVATKALFKAGHVDEAEHVVSLFTRDGEQANNLYDMQATWYEISAGRAYIERGEYGRALKRFLKVDSHFLDFVEDQFDFHQYCLRKQTMRVYVDMLRMEDDLYKHPVYAKAVEGAVAAYVQLFDTPGKSPEEVEAEKVAAMTPEEAKKYLQKKRKEEAKKLKEAENARAASAAATAGGKKGGGDSKKPVDTDPDGVLLATTKDPLGEATKLLNRLLTASPDRLESQLMAFEIYHRKKKLLLALKAVKKAGDLATDGGKESPRVHYALIRLASLVEQQQEGNDVVSSVLKDHVAKLLGSPSTTAAHYHAAWVQQHGNASLAHRFIAAQATAALYPTKRAHAAAELANAGPCGASHPECVRVHTWLSSIDNNNNNNNNNNNKNKSDGGNASSFSSEFSAACAKVFKWSRYFGGEKCVPLPENTNGVDAAAQGVEKLEM